MARQQSKGFLLRLDPQTMDMVERWAAQEFRSVNGQIQWIIADALHRYGRFPHSTADITDTTTPRPVDSDNK